MRYQDRCAGVLLKIERLKQNKGQKEVCSGICVPSYLSKIERNSVQPDQYILDRLFQRLGIKYFFDKELIESAEILINDYFESIFFRIDKHIFDKLKEMGQLLMYSPLTIDWLLVQAFEEKSNSLELLSQLEDVMTDRQKALFYTVHPINKGNAEQILELLKKAHRLLNNSFSLLKLMIAYFIIGEYDKVHQYADQCIAFALEEGNTWNLAYCYQLQGDAHACLNNDILMLPFYKRSINLLQNTLWQDNLSMAYYNIGATYLHCGKYALAMEYLEQSAIDEDDFLLNHKKSLAKIRAGHKEEAKKFLVKMEKWLLSKSGCQEQPQVEMLMYEEALMEMEENFLSKPEFMNLLEKLIHLLREQRHPGFYLFFSDVLKKAYCKQRKYKKALELDGIIS